MFQEEEDNVWGPAPLKTQSMDDPWGDSVPQASTSSRPGSPNFGTGSPTSGNILVTEPEELPWVNSNSGMPGAFEDTEDGFATPTETPASPQPRQDGNDKDDDFGDDDFGDFGEENDQDDGFGDFEESEAVAVPAPSHILVRPVYGHQRAPQ